YDLVAAAQRAGLDATFAGGSSRAVDAACRDVFEAAGRLHEYVHGTGHGVGLDIHELPFHNRTSDVTLEAGMVVTIEPGLYRGGFGGFRIEDLVLVTDAGHRVLTHSPKREL
ncbi:MAG: M24 family metallopeptidase, partial [Ilumatobacter sp.]